MKRQIISKGVAVHSRDIEIGVDKDYGWYVEKGELSLLERIKHIYRISLSDINPFENRDPPPLKRFFALLFAEKRAGLLLCDIPGPRRDKAIPFRRIISDTLYLEFEGAEKAGLLEYAAWLLTCPDEDCKQIQENAMSYAELLYLNAERKKEVYSLPFSIIKGNVTKFSGKRAVLCRDDMNFPKDPGVQQCAAYLRWLAKEHKRFFENGKGFVFVSTGRVGKEKCRQLADLYDTCLILTMTSEIQTETELGKNIFLTVLKRKYHVMDIAHEMGRILKKKYYVKDIALELKIILKKKYYLKDITHKMIPILKKGQ